MAQYRIGLIAAHSHIDYPRSLRLGVQNTLEEAGHTLVPIADLIPYHTLANAESYLRVACEVAARLNLDATIMPVGCMTANLSGDNQKALELLQVMDPERTLVLEREVEGFRCITKNNEPGMRACMCHLIENCGFTKIAFVSGPEKSTGARERETIYFDEMAAHGIEVPPRFFVRGDFGGDCADVIEELLDRNPDIEAIACACDLIAYTVYSVLHRRKLVVGVDIAVTGFDDNVRSAHMDPPLSTVHMTSYDYGCVAAEEALRICQGLPQRQRIITSTFVARNSCGESDIEEVERFRQLIHQKPFPIDEFVSIVMDSTISMAGPQVVCDFRAQVKVFMEKIRASYLAHRANPNEEVLLFSSHDLAALFEQDYSEFLSLEGFHFVAITLLEALLREADATEASWVVDQISYLHLRIARLLNTSVQTGSLKRDKREWIVFHMVDDALREDSNPKMAYQLILEELSNIGVTSANLYLLPEPVEFMGSRTFALSDTVQPLGMLVHGDGRICLDEKPLTLQRILDHALLERDHTSKCTVGGIMAGNELLGIAVLKDDGLNSHEQLMALLNLGSALKHLQMIANDRELNQLLSQHNLALEQQSQHDELTGLLNRRGKAVEVLKANLVNDRTAEEELQGALDTSNELAKSELTAMCLAADYYGMSNLPQEIATADLSQFNPIPEGEAELNAAMELTLSKNYDDTKQSISDSVNASFDALLNQINTTREKNGNLMQGLLFQLRIAVALLLCIVMVLVLALFMYVLKPLSRYVKHLKEGEALSPEGAYELHYLANAYNAIYEDNSKRIEHLREFAEQDSLTGISNRAGYDSFLATHTRNIALLLIDIDSFKEYNTVYGNDTGDAVLIKLAEALGTAFRSTDFPCRIEGDLFAVVMTNMSAESRDAIFNKIEQVNSMLAADSTELPAVSISVGAAFSTEGMSDHEIYEAASTALQQAKQARSGEVVFYGEGHSIK